jgi:SAM-dependent methyltransferase
MFKPVLFFLAVAGASTCPQPTKANAPNSGSQVLACAPLNDSTMLIPPQRDIPERLDLDHGSLREVRRSLRDIRRINRYLGGTALSVRGVLGLLESVEGEATVLDVGCGLGDVGVAIQEGGGAARAGGACDWAGHFGAATFSGRRVRARKYLRVRGDAFALPLRDRGVDAVHCSLFLHHFRAAQIESLGREFSRVARVGWFANDITRHTLPLWFFRTTWPIFARSALTRYDGSVSVRRAYTPREMSRVVRSIPGARVRAHVPFRLSVEWKRGRRAASTSCLPMTDFDVVIVGLGPAGASAAISLAQRGARVLALEAGEFPRHKVCGEFLSPESRATFGRPAVLGALQEAGARPMESVRVFASHGRARRGPRPIEVAMPAPALAVSRWEMDRILATQARRTGRPRRDQHARLAP